MCHGISLAKSRAPLRGPWWTGKPGSVVGRHSSRMMITHHLKRPTRWLDRADPHCLRSTPAYLVLLRGGFTLPVLLPVRRWALTPPFHPCLILPKEAIGGLFSAALSVGSPRPGITWPTALRSPDFPLPMTAATPWPTHHCSRSRPNGPHKMPSRAPASEPQACRTRGSRDRGRRNTRRAAPATPSSVRRRTPTDAGW